MEEKVKDILADVAPFLSFSEISSQYLKKGRSFLANKINETTINGVRYRLNKEEIDNLSKILEDLSKRLLSTAKHLKNHSEIIKRQTGAFFTQRNPFKHPLFLEWFNSIPNPKNIVEPFAGTCNIPRLVKETGIESEWKCFDINPIKQADFHIVKRDCIKNMPQGKIIITNPPYLAKNSAKKRGLEFPKTHFQDIYQHCLSEMLDKARYVAALLPESFITSKLFQERLYGVIRLTDAYFSDTSCPVCLALFVSKETATFVVYNAENKIGDYRSLINAFRFKKPKNEIDWKFNIPTGRIGVKCSDGIEGSIKFLKGDEINKESVVESSRHNTRVEGLPSDIDVDKFIQTCNDILKEYREATRDIELTSFKGRRANGDYRRRIDFGTIKKILNMALSFKSSYRY